MALKGDLASVDLAQVFQMLALNRKVGMLSIQSPRTWRALYFDDGGVTLYYNEHILLDRILNNLVRSGQLLESSVIEVRRQASQGGGSLVDSLLGGGYLTEEDLDALFRSELEEDIYDLFFWKNARFEFFEGATSFDGREGVINERFTFATDTLIMEAARRIDEWAYIKERIPGAMEVYRRHGKGHDVDNLDDSTLTVHDLIDGRRNIARLIEITGMAPFHVYKCVVQLLDDNVIEPLPPDILVPTGEQCTREGRLEDAINLFEKAIAAGERIPEAHFLAAEAYETAAEYELCVYHLKCVAEYHASENQLKQAVETLRKAIDIIPTDLGARERLVELTIGHPEFKNEDFDPAAHGKTLVDLYLEVGEVDRVRSILERLLRENPKDLELKKILINVHTKAGDTRRVIELFESIAEDLVADHRPIEAIKYLQKILMLDRARSDISDRIRSLYELDERRRSRKRSLLALGVPFCLLSILGAVYYMYDKNARAEFERLDLSPYLEANDFAGAEQELASFMEAYPFTMVLGDVRSELLRVQGQRKKYEAEISVANTADAMRLKRLRMQYGLKWKLHRDEFKAGHPERSLRLVEEVLELVKEANQPRDLRWAEEQQVAKAHAELKAHLSEAAALNHQAKEAWDRGDWQVAREKWLQLVNEYELTLTAANARLPVQVSSRPSGARILRNGEQLMLTVNGEREPGTTPAVVLLEHDRPESLSLTLDGFERADLQVDAKNAPRGVFAVVMKVIPDSVYRFESPVRTAAGTDGEYLAVGLSGGRVGYGRIDNGNDTRTIALNGLSALVGQPSVSGGRMFFATNEGDLQSIAIGPSSGDDWIARLENPPTDRIVLRNGRVFFVDMAETLVCFDQTNGSRPLWTMKLSGEASGRPTLDGAHVYVGTRSGSIRVFKTNGDPVRDYQVSGRIATPVHRVGPYLVFGATDGTLRANFVNSGREKWRLRLGRALDGSDLAVSVGAIIVRGDGNRLLRVDPDDGRIMAQVELAHPMRSGPIISDNRVITVARKPLDQGRSSDLLQAWQLDDLSPLWEYENGQAFSGAVTADRESIYVPDSEGNLLRIR